MSDKAKNIVIIICLILIFLMGGYLVYDRLIKNKPIEDDQTVEVEPTKEINPTGEIIRKDDMKSMDDLIVFTSTFTNVIVQNKAHEVKLVSSYTIEEPIKMLDDTRAFGVGDLEIYIDGILIKKYDKIQEISLNIQPLSLNEYSIQGLKENNLFVIGDLIAFDYYSSSFDAGADSLYFYTITGDLVGVLGGTGYNSYGGFGDEKYTTAYEVIENSIQYWTYDYADNEAHKYKLTVEGSKITQTLIEKDPDVSISGGGINEWIPKK